MSNRESAVLTDADGLKAGVREFPRSLPRWQVLLVLVGFPVVYWLNSFTPWSYGLFVDGDRGWYVGFAASVLVLHWGTTLLALHLVRRGGGTWREIGLNVNLPGVVIMLSLLLALGSAMVALRPWCAPRYDEIPDWMALYPFTTTESVMMLLMAVSAGFCEEVIYRGFAIRVLQGRGTRTWAAVLLALLSFIFMHGVMALFVFPLLIVAGLIASAIFLWRKSLTPVICLHAVFDLMMVWVARIE
jgi:hypothetical protein